MPSDHDPLFIPTRWWSWCPSTDCNFMFPLPLFHICLFHWKEDKKKKKETFDFTKFTNTYGRERRPSTLLTQQSNLRNKKSKAPEETWLAAAFTMAKHRLLLRPPRIVAGFRRRRLIFPKQFWVVVSGTTMSSLEKV